MFDRFRSEYAALRDKGAPGTPWLDDHLTRAEGYAEFAEEYAGASFAGGLYRFHDAKSGPLALSLVTDMFPEFQGRVCPFGFDWLGQQFALDLGRTDGGQPLVLLFEPGTGEVLEIPTTFVAFHEEELVEYADAALAKDFFQEWAANNYDSIPLAHDMCVGYQQPLFLGGKDVVGNLEVSNIDVYWTIFGQIRQRVLQELGE